MRNTIPFLALVALFAPPALAQSVPGDVPPGHWTYDALRVLFDKGIVLGEAGGRFAGDRPLTRYEMAALLKRVLDKIPVAAPSAPAPAPRPANGGRPTRTTEPKPAVAPAQALTPAERAALARLTSELLPELAVLGTDLKSLAGKVDGFEQKLIDMAQALKDVRDVNLDQQKDIDTLKKIHVNGYLQLRHDALLGDPGLFRQAGAGGTGQRPTLGGPHVGGPSNGFLVRRGRMKVEGPSNANDGYVFQLDFGSVSGVNLRDAWADIRSGMPRNTTFRIGQFPPPFTYILPNSSRVRESPERAIGFSDSGNAGLIFKDTLAALGGDVTAGSVVPLFNNQDRDLGAQLTYKGRRATSAFGWFNGEGREVLGQRPLNGALTFMGRVEQRFPMAMGDAFIGLSRYDGGHSVRGGAPVSGVTASFRLARRAFDNLDMRWEGRDGLQMRHEVLHGTFEATPDRAQFLADNKISARYTTLRKDISSRAALSLTHDVFRPTNRTVAGVSASDYARKTLQGGLLYWIGPKTRLRLWYVQALSAYDPSAPVGSPLRGKLAQTIGEIQIEY